jgi:hypothetical protein
MNNDIFQKGDILFQKTEEWKKSGGFKHRKPCKEWKQGLRCRHYAKARYRHFKTETDKLLEDMGLT